MIVHLSQDGTKLRLFFMPEEQAHLKECADEGSPVTEGELLESWLCNSEFEWVSPEICCDLTDAPMVGIFGEEVSNILVKDMIACGRALGSVEGTVYDISRTFRPLLARWAFMNYQITSMVDVVIEKGVITLDGHCAEHVLPGLLACYGQKPKFRIETEDGKKFCTYNMTRGPALTEVPAFAYTWDTAQDAQLQLSAYKGALDVPLAVRHVKKS